MTKLLDGIRTVVKYWWLSVIVGVLMLIVGVCSVAAPLSALGALTIFFIASLIAGGLFDIIFSISNRAGLRGWGWTLALGILSLVFGLFLITKPIESILTLVYLAGFWVMFASITSISGSIEMQQAGVKDWGWMLAFGILGLIFSFIMIANPVFAASFVVMLFSLSLIFYGVVRIFYGFKMKKIKKEIS